MKQALSSYFFLQDIKISFDYADFYTTISLNLDTPARDSITKLTLPNILHILLCLDFWDTAGQEKFQSMHPSYYHQAHACILVFDATRKNTYKNLSNWYDEMRKYRPSIPCICAVNKIDGM